MTGSWSQVDQRQVQNEKLRSVFNQEPMTRPTGHIEAWSSCMAPPPRPTCMYFQTLIPGLGRPQTTPLKNPVKRVSATCRSGWLGLGILDI